MPTICASRAASASTFGPPPPIDERRVRPLHRLGLTVELGDPVVLTLERERPVGEESLEDR